MKKKFFLSNKLKKYLFFGLTFFSVSVMLMSLTACGVSTALLNSLIEKGDGKNFFSSSNSELNLNKIAKLSLQNDSGYNELLKQKTGDVLLNWYKNNDDKNFQEKYTDWEIEVDNTWDDKVKELKKQYGNDYKVYLQKDFLDPNGGTKSDWEHKELMSKAIDDFKSNLFLVNYLDYYENYDEYKGDRIPKDIYKSEVDDQANWKNLQFATDESKDRDFSSEINVFFAKIQESVFKKWVRKEVPLLVSSVFFNYSLPTKGLSSLYNDTFFTQLPTGSTYEFPSFAAIEESNDKEINQEQRFKNFVNDLGVYYSSKNGGVNFSQTVNDEPTTNSFVTLNSLFDGNDVNFASSISYILGKSLGVFSNNFNVVKSNFSKPILSNFVTNAKNSSSYFDKLIFTQAAVSSTIKDNPNSYYKYYETDIFNGQNAIADLIDYESNSNLVLTRVSDGVRAVAIDGLTYFVNADSGEINFDNLEAFLKYRSVQKSMPKNNNNINTNNGDFNAFDKIRDYFKDESNMYRLLYELIDEGFFVTKELSTEKISNILFSGHELEIKNLIDKYDNYYEFSQKKKNSLLLRTKFNASLDSKYAKLVSTLSSYKSLGLTGRLPFIVSSDGTVNGLESVINYWWIDKNNRKPLPDITTKELFSEYNSSKNEYIKAVDNYIESLKLTNLSLKDGSNEYYFNYSQQIFTSDSEINQVINTAISNSDNKSSFSEIKNDIFKDKLKGFFDIDSDKFVDSQRIKSQDLQIAVSNTYKLKAMQEIRGSNTYSYSYGYISDAGDLSVNKSEFIEKVWQYAISNKTVDLTDYYLFIYAINYLLTEDYSGNLRIKNYLNRDVPYGEQAYVIWTAPTSVSDRKADKDMFKLPINPSEYFGDFDDQNKNSFKNYDNSTGKFPTLLSNDEYNNLINPYRYASHKSVFDSNNNLGYGFLGLDTANTYFNSSVPNSIHKCFFEDYGSNGLGSLFGYRNKDELLDYIDQFSDKSSLIRLAKKLNELYDRIDIEKIINPTSENFSLEKMKENLKYSVNLVTDDDIFVNKEGFIGKKYIGEDFNLAINGDNKPMNYDNTIGYFSYIVPLNNYKIQSINNDYLVNESSRLGLDISTFFQVVCQYAMTNKIKSDALSDMLVKNNGRILSYDQRLVNVLGSEWCYVEHYGNKNN